MRTNHRTAFARASRFLMFAAAILAPALVAASAVAEDPPAHVALLKDAKTVNGLIPMYQKGEKLYAELSGDQYNSEYIVLISIARGIGQGDLLGGMSWQTSDDDWVWSFRKVDDNVHIIRRNVRFKADKGTPEATAVKNAYTDSVLFSLPAKDKGPKGGDLIDLTPVFMSDLPQIGAALPGFSFARDKSSWAAVKGFPKNVELQLAATYSSGGRQAIESVADSRGVTLNVHYSISKVPSNDYTPRLADDRIGYFLTVAKDFSKSGQRDQFARFINRWNLKKAKPGDKPSPPKEPVIFWVEKTVPFQYRKPIVDGIREWNKAFEAAGFLEAIEVRQQPDDADWDPEDVHYNTFRWITAGAGFAMGPSRVNPYTGEILDADIIFDADFLTSWKQQFETLTPATVTAMTGGPLTQAEAQASPRNFLFQAGRPSICALAANAAPDFALGEIAFSALAPTDPAKSAEELERLIAQGLKYIAMHEVGHTLGLRHNFKASTWKSLKDMNDAAKAQGTLVSSVMDYSPVNIVPQGWTQGDYYQSALGPYDVWAIEYGYKELSGGTKGEVAELSKIASRGSEAGLDFATDEDTVNWDPDPHSNRFDLGGDAIEYARNQAQLLKELTPGLKDRLSKEGDDFVQSRQAFNVLLSKYGQSMHFAARYIGGMNTSRSHKGDKDARPPVEPLPAAKQREALGLLTEMVFSEAPFQFPHEMYNYLAASRWRHWGANGDSQKDFPLHETVAIWQDRILGQTLSPTVLARIHDIELKTPPDQDAFTTAELIEGLTKSIFSEVESVKEGDYTNRKPAIGSLRRNLQRSYLSRLSNMALGNSSAPEDCQTIAYAELASLRGRIDQLLTGKVALDSYSRAHLQETSSRIGKILDARVSLDRL